MATMHHVEIGSMGRRHGAERGIKGLIGRLGLVVAALVGSSGAPPHVSVGRLGQQEAGGPPHDKSKTPVPGRQLDRHRLHLERRRDDRLWRRRHQVDISANGSVQGHFTPGAALKLGASTFKFSGTAIGKYGFAPKTISKTGSFPVTYTSASNLMISVNGSPPTPTSKAATTGSYKCSGKGLLLTFPAGGDEISYTAGPHASEVSGRAQARRAQAIRLRPKSQ